MKLLTQMFTALRNGQTARKQVIQITYSTLCWNVLTVLFFHGYINGLQKNDNKILVVLKYVNYQPAIRKLKQISTSSQRVYSSYAHFTPTHHGLGLLLVSTSQGILSSQKAQEAQVCGEILCEIF